MRKLHQVCLVMLLISLAAGAASAQSFRVQCPTSTITHPATLHDNNLEPAYTGPTVLTSPSPTTFQAPSSNVNGAIKCQQVSGGDGYATMADGTQTYMFSFGPLSGLADIAAGLPGTEPPSTFNTVYSGTVPLQPGDPATTDGASDTGLAYTPGTLGAFTYNGAVGLTPDYDCLAANAAAASFTPPTPPPCPNLPAGGLDGHVDPRQILDVGVMNGNLPAPLIAFDEDDAETRPFLASPLRYYSYTHYQQIVRAGAVRIAKSAGVTTTVTC